MKAVEVAKEVMHNSFHRMVLAARQRLTQRGASCDDTTVRLELQLDVSSASTSNRIGAGGQKFRAACSPGLARVQ